MRVLPLCLACLLLACTAPLQGAKSADPGPAAPLDAGALSVDAGTAHADAAGTAALPWPTSACRSAVQAPKWWHDAVGYEVFVRSFADSDGDGVGDLKGLIAHLDYLNDGKPGQGADLEVDVLWLMPVNPSPSYHGYDVTDYRSVNPQYGTDADLDALVAAAHARGMKVVLDLVLNHTSSQHPWFVESAAAQAKGVRSGGHADWYPWRADDPGWKQPFGSAKAWHEKGMLYYYGVFWTGMPDLDFTRQAVTNEMRAVGLYWLGRGLDGFRLDAVRYLVETGPGKGQADTAETIAWWQQFAAALAQVKPATLLVGEAWAANAIAAKYHAGGSGLGMTLDFDVASALLSAVQSTLPNQLRQAVCAQDALFPAGAARGTFLTNHDMVRVATLLQGDLATTGARPDLSLAAGLLMTLPGTPWLYYGEEIGMTNGPGADDKDKRLPMQWDASPGGGFTQGKPWQPLNNDAATLHVAGQTMEKQSLLSLYRQLIRLRKAHPALRTGTMETVPAEEHVLAYLRADLAGERWLCVFNLGDASATLATPAATDGLTGDLIQAGSLALPPRTFRILQLQ